MAVGSDRWDPVRTRWAAHAVHTAPPATEAELVAFETRYGVRLPSDLRSYFAELGGMDPRAVPAYDRQGFAIWPLTEVRPAESGSRMFVFADYLNWSWAYAIELDVTADRPHPIALLGAARPQQPVADSFTAFVDLYLSDALLLYPMQ